MTDKPRPWPNQAKEARDQAAEAAVRAMRALEPVVSERIITETERLRRESEALIAIQKVLGLLVQMGAPVRWIDL